MPIPDPRMNPELNPKGLPIHCMSVLISANRCPQCLGTLDSGYACLACGYDGMRWLNLSLSINNAAYDLREG